MANFRVKHTQVGPFSQGHIIHPDQLKGVDVDRLLSLDAIEPTDDPHSGDPAYGPLFGPQAPRSPMNPGGYQGKLQDVVFERAPVEQLPPAIHEQTLAEATGKGAPSDPLVDDKPASAPKGKGK